MLTDGDDVGVMQLSALNCLTVDRRAVRALEILQKVYGLHSSNPRVVARHGVILNQQIVIRLSADRKAIPLKLDRARALALEFDEKFRRVGDDAHRTGSDEGQDAFNNQRGARRCHSRRVALPPTLTNTTVMLSSPPASFASETNRDQPLRDVAEITGRLDGPQDVAAPDAPGETV